MVRSLSSLLVALALFAPGAFADVQTLSPITLRNLDRHLVADVPAGSEGTSDKENVITVNPSNKRELVANSVGTATVTFKAGGADVATLEVTVEPTTPTVTLGGNPVSLSDETVVYSGGPPLDLEVQMQGRDGSTRTITDGAELTSANTELIEVVDRRKLKITAPSHTDLIDPPAPRVRVDLKFGGQTVPLNFIVAERPSSATIELPSRIQEKSSTVTQVKVKGAGGGTYPSTSAQFANLYQYKCEEDSPVARMAADDRTLTIDELTASQSTINVKCNILGIDGSLLLSQATPKIVIAFQSGGRIVLSPNTLSLFAGQNSKVTAQLFGRDNSEIVDRTVDFSVDNSAEGLVLAKQGDRATIVTASKEKSKIPAGGLMTVTAKAITSDGKEITASLPVSIVNAAGFTRVRGGLEMIDYETAKDLYGSRTAEDFYIAKITLLNDLGGDLAGASILVFSSSLGIGVNMQKAEFAGNKMRKRDVKDLVENKEWKALTFGDLRKLGLPLNYPLNMKDVPHASAPGSPAFDIDKQIVYTCDDVWYAEQTVEAFELTEEEAKLSNEDKAKEKIFQEKRRQRDERVAAARLRQLRYRPYPYDMVIKSFDPRDNRTGRSLTFRALTFAGSVASFITGVPNFGATSQFIAVNEKVTSVLIPGLAVFWPSMRDTQRQNLVDDTMHPIEEIPYGSSLTKVIFLPKYPFQGLSADHWFRISEICPFDFQVEVAISHKEKQTVPVSPIAQ